LKNSNKAKKRVGVLLVLTATIIILTRIVDKTHRIDRFHLQRFTDESFSAAEFLASAKARAVE